MFLVDEPKTTQNSTGYKKTSLGGTGEVFIIPLMSPKLYQVGAYIRPSVEDAVYDSGSVENQHEMLSKLIDHISEKSLPCPHESLRSLHSSRITIPL